jgi:hypothetical protein
VVRGRVGGGRVVVLFVGGRKVGGWVILLLRAEERELCVVRHGAGGVKTGLSVRLALNNAWEVPSTNGAAVGGMRQWKSLSRG